MIKLIVGLGNPGRQYEKNRHNAGFLFLDRLVENSGQTWSNEPKFKGFIANCVFGNVSVLLLKPQTFMNRSGLSVAAVCRFYKIKSDEVLVVHDELDLDVGVVKLKKGGGHAGHNGLRDIVACLGDNDFYRVRFGVGRPEAGRQVADYVLSNPSKEERGMLVSANVCIESRISSIVAGEISQVMSELNRRDFKLI